MPLRQNPNPEKVDPDKKPPMKPHEYERMLEEQKREKEEQERKKRELAKQKADAARQEEQRKAEQAAAAFGEAMSSRLDEVFEKWKDRLADEVAGRVLREMRAALNERPSSSKLDAGDGSRAPELDMD